MTRPAGDDIGAPYAVIDIGTNTIRLLVAQVTPEDGLRRLRDDTVTARLGHGVDASGRLETERMTRAARAVADLARRARAAGARSMRAVATSAVRDASNRDQFVALVAEVAGVSVEVIGGEREAALTYRGAMIGRPPGGRHLVADIGGGSTEIILAVDGAIQFERSLQLGSGRLTEQCLASDPPRPEEIARARQRVADLLASVPDVSAKEVIIVGGTGSALLRVTPRQADDARLTAAHLEEALAALSSRSAVEQAEAWSIDVDRARVLPGGILIIQALMARAGMGEVMVSRGSIREGVLLDMIENDGREVGDES